MECVGVDLRVEQRDRSIRAEVTSVYSSGPLWRRAERMDSDTIWILVPLTALAIPLLAVLGRVVVKPIADAIAKLGEAEQAAAIHARSDRRFAELDARLARMEQRIEQLVGRTQAEQALHRQLESASPAIQPPPLESDTRIPVSRL